MGSALLQEVVHSRKQCEQKSEVWLSFFVGTRLLIVSSAGHQCRLSPGRALLVLEEGMEWC